MVFYKILHSGNKQFCQRGYIIYIFNHNSYSAIAGYSKPLGNYVCCITKDINYQLWQYTNAQTTFYQIGRAHV